MLYGYARVSTNGQARDGNSLDAQVHALKNAGAEIIFSDVFSGSKNNRPQLDKLLKVIENGDTLIITKLDRIARSLIQGIQLLETLSNKGVIIDVLNMSIIDNSPTGKLIRNIMLCFFRVRARHDPSAYYGRQSHRQTKTPTTEKAVPRNSNEYKSITHWNYCKHTHTSRLPP